MAANAFEGVPGPIAHPSRTGRFHELWEVRMRRGLIATAVVLLIATRAPVAFGQCSISMIDNNGTPMLCADTGDSWQWTGPNGFSSTDLCVTASTPGTYTLRVFDGTTNTWSDPCSQTVGTPPPGPSCSITGVDNVCAGSSVQWCGPAGNFTYAWSGPGGFTSSAVCVDASAAGTYSLTLTDRASGAAGDPCSLALRTLDCAPPPPPPSPPLDACPRPARWWSGGCAAGSPIDADAFAHVAASVDADSAVWDFGGSAQGLCALLSQPRRGTPMGSASRQYAAVLANLAAASSGVHDYEGHSVGLDANQVLDGVRGVAAGTTVGQWVESTEHALLGMAGGSSRDRAARETCRRIRWQAREINQGPHTGSCPGQLNAMLQESDDDDLGLAAAGASSLTTVGTSGGNDPLSGGSRMRWSLEQSARVELSILDVTGRIVRHLVSGVYSAGTHDFSWDGRDDDGRSMRAGAYFVAGTIGGERASQRFFVLR